jgi:hypothetical protein
MTRLNSRCYYKINDIPAFIELVLLDKSDLKQKMINKLEVTTKNNQTYKIIRYDKNYLCDDFIFVYGVFKSVVVDSSNRVVCFSPPKSVSFDTFCKMHPETSENYVEYIVAEEYVEGTMINLFWDENVGLSGSWEISTRNNVGCENIFKKNRSIREIFIEVCIKKNLDFDSLEKRYCYNFILQHPNFDLVKQNNTEETDLYLIKLHEIINTEDGTVNIFNVELDDNIKLNSTFTHIKFPEIYYDWSTYDELKEKYASINTPYSMMGVVVYNKYTHVRTKLKNPNYDSVKYLKTNHFKNEYLYLSLRKEGKLKEYLSIYSQYRDDFWIFKKYLYLFTENLFQMYICCYIKKNKQVKDFHLGIQIHLKSLHEKYMKELIQKKQYITISKTIEYVNALNPSVLMYSLYLTKVN